MLNLLTFRWMKGLRTTVLSGVTLLIAILAMPEVQGVVPDDWLPLTMAIVAVLNLMLRLDTNTSVGKKS
jgi:hypothetical protein